MSDDLNERYEKAIKIIDNTYERLERLKSENKQLISENNYLKDEIEKLKKENMHLRYLIDNTKY